MPIAQTRNYQQEHRVHIVNIVNIVSPWNVDLLDSECDEAQCRIETRSDRSPPESDLS